MKLTKEEVDKVYADFYAWEKEVADHNEQFLNSLGEEAQKDFGELMEGCTITEKIEFVDGPKGQDNQEEFGIFKNVHVDQWCVNMEGDSFNGYIYTLVKDKWIKIPFAC